MTAPGFAFIDTAIGAVGLVWSEAAIVGVLLPGPDGAAAREPLARRHPQAEERAMPAFVAEAAARIRRLLEGERIELAHVPVDLSGLPPFERKACEQARKIPPGETRTYGEVAALLGEPGAARAVGQAMGRNPCPILVPCHRVTAASGGTGGFSAPGGRETKLRMLNIEGALRQEGGLFADLPLAARPERR